VTEDNTTTDLDACPVACSTEIVDPNSTRSIYEEALAELNVTERDEAKAVIASRIKEIQRMRTLLARAEADLAKLMEKTPAEIAMMRF
jgi:hypothetical protein